MEDMSESRGEGDQWVDVGWGSGDHQKLFYHSLLQLDRENIMKGSWSEIRAGRDCSPVPVKDKTGWI